eukprot:4693278-Pyramimonas_sp.AAC.1
MRGLSVGLAVSLNSPLARPASSCIQMRILLAGLSHATISNSISDHRSLSTFGSLRPHEGSDGQDAAPRRIRRSGLVRSTRRS